MIRMIIKIEIIIIIQRLSKESCHMDKNAAIAVAITNIVFIATTPTNIETNIIQSFI